MGAMNLKEEGAKLETDFERGCFVRKSTQGRTTNVEKTQIKNQKQFRHPQNVTS